jgi:hypothetical protein
MAKISYDDFTQWAVEAKWRRIPFVGIWFYRLTYEPVAACVTAGRVFATFLLFSAIICGTIAAAWFIWTGNVLAGKLAYTALLALGVSIALYIATAIVNEVS